LSSKRSKDPAIPRWRYQLVVLLLLCMPLLALWHIAGLQVISGFERGFEFLQRQGEARTVRQEEIPAYRGLITDRRGEPLAVSTPVITVWADPKYFTLATDHFAELATELGISQAALASQVVDLSVPEIIALSPAMTMAMARARKASSSAERRMLAREVEARAENILGFVSLARDLGQAPDQLQSRADRYRDKRFMFLARHMMPFDAERALAHNVPGVAGRQEYKRFYPAGEVAAQLVGYTNIDDQGQEGIELAFERSLAGHPGSKTVLKDRDGHVIKELGLVEQEQSGENIELSIDLRLQYLAYRELKAAVNRFNAAAGALVMLDVETGEILAMVNQPSYNPNNRRSLDINGLRNRVMTDIIEPGSTMKPLTMAAALESGKFSAGTLIDTNPGYLWAAGKTFTDHSNYGVLDMTGILKKSSQVGTTKIARELDPNLVRDMFARFGLGEPPGTGFPGESSGMLPEYVKWREIDRITMAFGYGLSATPLQVARAYSVLANDGIKKPVSLLKVTRPPLGEQVVDATIARQIREMLITVTETGGTATRAAIDGYSVAGKTGTSHKVGPNGYEAKRYVGLFAGMVPAENPRLVTVVVIDDPKGKGYFGGLVAAPTFAKINADALRLLRIPPDVLPDTQVAGDSQPEKDAPSIAVGGDRS
jgi:cell division protein FtsI (penicillin-binding protein 3)